MIAAKVAKPKTQSRPGPTESQDHEGSERVRSQRIPARHDTNRAGERISASFLRVLCAAGGVRSRWPLQSHEDGFVSDVPNVTVSPRSVARSVNMAAGNRSSRMRGHLAAQAGAKERKGRRVPLYGPPPDFPRCLRPLRVPRH